MLNLKISIKKIGEKSRKLEMPIGSNIKDLKQHLGVTEGAVFRRLKGRKNMMDDDPLKDGDVLIIASKVIGGAEIKCGSRKWVIHKNDMDNQPSDFHMHDYAKKEKLDLYTGKIYKARDMKENGIINPKYHRRILQELCERKDFQEKAEKAQASLKDK